MDIYLLIVTLLAIAIVILGVSWWKWHAFISLTVASLFLAIMSGLNVTKIVAAYETGVGSVLGHLVGILALGTILGKMMSDSGAGMQVADFFIRFFGVKITLGYVICRVRYRDSRVFEVGIVILLPLVISIRKTTKQNILLIALPVIAGLSIVHGLVPPHPGAMTAIGIYNANLGKVLLYSLIIALPAAIIAGPIFAKWVHKRVIPENEPELIRVTTVSTDLPSRKVSFFIILLPVVLMILSVVAPYISLPKKMTEFFVFMGSPVIALLISCFAAFYLLGIRQGINKKMIKN